MGLNSISSLTHHSFFVIVQHSIANGAVTPFAFSLMRAEVVRMNIKVNVFRKKLMKQREELLSEAEQTINSKLVEDKQSFPDPTDQAAAELDNNFMLKLRGREQKLLKKIDEAIARIDEGSYGVCESCGGPIGIKRLEARPVTTLCIDCKTEQEENEKRQVG
jgi:DnaK suppressor protein